MIGYPWRRGNRNLRRLRLVIFAVLLVALIAARGNASATNAINVVWYVVAGVFIVVLFSLYVRRQRTEGFGRRRAQRVERPSPSSTQPPNTGWSTGPRVPIASPSSEPPTTTGLTFSGERAPSVETPPESNNS